MNRFVSSRTILSQSRQTRTSPVPDGSEGDTALEGDISGGVDNLFALPRLEKNAYDPQ